MNIKDLAVDGSNYEISLFKLIGKRAVDVRGYLIDDFGDPSFKITKIELEDGAFMGVEGEHDLPYLVTWGGDVQPNFDVDTLYELYDQSSEDDA